MKEGLYFEDGEMIYYRNGEPCHAGVVEIEGKIYYIASKGRAVKGEHIVHSEMSNGILKHGTYTFGEDYVLKKNSYKAPTKRKAKRNSKAKSDIISFSKGAKKKIIAVAAVAVICLAALLVAGIADNNTVDVPEPVPEVKDESDQPSDIIAGIVFPEIENEVLLCSNAAKKLYDGEMPPEEAIMTGDPYYPLVLSYSFEENDGFLYLSEKKDLSDAVEYILPGAEKVVRIDNLKTGTEYFYTIICGDEETSGSFRTAPSTRFVYMPGVYNTRDIGGYKNLDGKTVKQGLLIRGTEIDGLVENYYFIKPEDVEKLQETFGFVYDFDLREPSLYPGEYVSIFGPDVEHKFYGAPQYGAIFREENKETIKRIFMDLADPENYPMYFHCTYGADRTGTFIFLLQGILNMPEEDMVREYRLTAFTSKTFIPENNTTIMISGLQPYEGDTLAEKTVDFLVNEIGVTEEEIESIRNIFLE